MAGETILVVDDEVNIRELARMYLEQEGFQIVTAVNGQQALQSPRTGGSGAGCATPDLAR